MKRSDSNCGSYSSKAESFEVICHQHAGKHALQRIGLNTTSSDPDDDELVPPESTRVVRRAFCLSAIVCRSFIDESPDDEFCRALHAQMPPWLSQVDAASELEGWEATALSQPLGGLESQTRVDGTWLSEGLAVLAWSLRRFELPPHDRSVDPRALTNAMEFLQPEAAILLTTLSLRSSTEIETGARQSFAIHWRLRQFSLHPERMNFADFARTAWFGPLNIEGVPFASSDLSIGGVPISEADPSMWRLTLSIARERHRAFNWLLGYESEYSEVAANT